MKIRHSSKFFRLKPPANTQFDLAESDNLLFSPSELKQMHNSDKISRILKIAIPCLLIAVIGTTTYAIQGKVNHLPDNSSVATSSDSSQLSVPTSTITDSSQSSVPVPTSTSESTTPVSTDSQTTNDSNLQAQLNAIQAQAMASVNAADASANAAQAQADIEFNTVNAEAIAANQAAAADEQAAAQDLADVNNPITITPAEQAAAKANAARLQCIAQANGQYATAMGQLEVQGGTRGLNATGVANTEADLQNQLTSATTSCNNQ